MTHSAIGAFYEVYNTLRFGHLEQIYVNALAFELRERGHVVEREVGVRVWYKGQVVGWERLDLLVDRCLVVEVKSTPALHSGAHRQLEAYLSATRLGAGLLLHFGPEARFYRAGSWSVRGRASTGERQSQESRESRAPLSTAPGETIPPATARDLSDS
jgi:GxxExxY protein